MGTYPLADLARDLGFGNPDDVREVACWLFPGVRDDLSAMMCGQIRAYLDPHGERTAPAGYYWPGHQPPETEAGRRFRSATNYSDGPYLYPDEDPPAGPWQAFGQIDPR